MLSSVVLFAQSGARHTVGPHILFVRRSWRRLTLARPRQATVLRCRLQDLIEHDRQVEKGIGASQWSPFYEWTE